MPSLEEHCQSTLKRYGVEGRNIHQWLDQPSRKYATGHRQFRHDTETIKLVGEIFGKEYGKSLAENIALDHIMLDHEEEVKRSSIVVMFPEKEIPSIPCPYCRTLLNPSDQVCPNCGASRTRIVEEFDRAYEMEKIKLQEKRKELREELKQEKKFREMTQEERFRLFFFMSEHDKRYEVLKRVVEEDSEKYLEFKEKLQGKMKVKGIFALGFFLTFTIGGALVGWSIAIPYGLDIAIGYTIGGFIVGFVLAVMMLMIFTT